MGNLLQGSARVLVTAPPSALAPIPRFPGFAAVQGHHHRRAWSDSHRSHSCNTRRFSSEKRPLGAQRSEASRGACPEPPRYSPHPPESEDRDDDPVAQATLRWVRSTVVGLNLCPWAGSALVGGRMQVVVHPPRPPLPPAGTTAAGSGDAGERHFGGSGLGEEGDGLLEGLVEFAARQAMALGGLEGEAAVNATTLVVARPPVAEDFEEFLGAVEAVDDFLDDSGLRGTVQLATFHPQYRFEGSGDERLEGSEDDDAANYTNRSPYPVLHLLLEDQVSAAVAQVGDPEKVWQRNVETTRKLGVEAMRRGVEACIRSPAKEEGGDGEKRR